MSGRSLNAVADTVYDLGRQNLQGTPVEDIGSDLYWNVTKFIHGHRSPINFFKVHNLPEPFDPYLIALDKPQNQVVHAQYERPVLEKFAELVDADRTVWEVGARWGYYTFAACSVAEKVVAAEADPDRLSLLHASRLANDATNVRIQGGAAGSDYKLNDFDPPDVAVIDVEGAEGSVLSGATQWLNAGTELLLEIHGPHDNDLHRRIDGRLRVHGYGAVELARWTPINRNIWASPDLPGRGLGDLVDREGGD